MQQADVDYAKDPAATNTLIVEPREAVRHRLGVQRRRRRLLGPAAGEARARRQRGRLLGWHGRGSRAGRHRQPAPDLRQAERHGEGRREPRGHHGPAVRGQEHHSSDHERWRRNAPPGARSTHRRAKRAGAGRSHSGGRRRESTEPALGGVPAPACPRSDDTAQLDMAQSGTTAPRTGPASSSSARSGSGPSVCHARGRSRPASANAPSWPTTSSTVPAHANVSTSCSDTRGRAGHGAVGRDSGAHRGYRVGVGARRLDDDSLDAPQVVRQDLAHRGARLRSIRARRCTARWTTRGDRRGRDRPARRRQRGARVTSARSRGSRARRAARRPRARLQPPSSARSPHPRRCGWVRRGRSRGGCRVEPGTWWARTPAPPPRAIAATLGRSRRRACRAATGPARSRVRASSTPRHRRRTRRAQPRRSPRALPPPSRARPDGA